MKKISLILVICVACSVGIFFGVRWLGQSKKTVGVSVAELNQQTSGENKQPEQEVAVEKQSIDENANEKKIENTQPMPEVVTEKDEKVVPKEQQTASENKTSSTRKIVSKLISWGFTKSSGRKIDTIVVHTSYNSLGGDEYDAGKIIEIYKQYEVSAHYLIARDGTIYQLVADQNIAWHAGVSEMPDGRKNVNDFSIGVEVINTKDGKFASEQYLALNALIESLKKKYLIKNVLGHDEIAPGRKTDPWNIDWKKVQK